MTQYGPYPRLPTEGGRVGFLGIAPSGREGARENTGNFLHGYAARHILGEFVNLPNAPPRKGSRRCAPNSPI